MVVDIDERGGEMSDDTSSNWRARHRDEGGLESEDVLARVNAVLRYVEAEVG